ncbi:hypothetical protein AAT19DRAFT_16734 [Rhodotorula toruloides]|uniref:Uncharacterized protein n=1 Tax=Rhodotorula toruloides TaxID=5286 RepID=A0A2T0A4A1_RHOTO|nr:hypothetical protein AAT19DRAFT_16734 [Rhodotorula toruloides]
MDSLGSLNTALPPNEQAEALLASSFRQAALSITALFKQGKKATSKAFIAGQRQALQEAPLAGGGGAVGPVDVARLINFICPLFDILPALHAPNFHVPTSRLDFRFLQSSLDLYVRTTCTLPRSSLTLPSRALSNPNLPFRPDHSPRTRTTRPRTKVAQLESWWERKCRWEQGRERDEYACFYSWRGRRCSRSGCSRRRRD